MLFQDNVDRWIQEESVVGPMNSPPMSPIRTEGAQGRNSSIYEGEDDVDTPTESPFRDSTES